MPIKIDNQPISSACLQLRAASCAALILVLGAGTSLAGVPYPKRDTPKPVDAGLLDETAGSAKLTVTVMLKLHDPAGAEAFVQHVSTPGDSMYRHYLTPAEFAARFGPTDADVAKVAGALEKFGLSAARVSTTTLHVTGIPADLERAFGVSLHQFNVAATRDAAAYSFRAPLQAPKMPDGISALVHGVAGLDNRPALSPHLRRAPAGMRATAALSHAAGPSTPDAPGNWTVVDFADWYNVTPLYTAGVKGTGQTIGIATLASFTPKDAFTYWKSAGLSVASNRITTIEVDGGSGPPSDDSGSDETTLDVEQSGGIAPAAKVRVYEAPNTNQGFVDLFAKAIDENLADAISCSWGEWEWFDTYANAPVSNPVSGMKTSSLLALHQLFVQAAAQGQSLMSAAGDAGAYDANDGMAPPDYSLALSVDNPASDTMNTAAGGTTLPGTITFSGTDPVITAKIPGERVWGWNYIEPVCAQLKMDPITCGIFPVGGGGGVSIEFAEPFYQKAIKGIQASQPNQVLLNEDTIPPTTISTLPANYAGRNVPDVSLNSDPYTGYALGYTSSAGGGYSVTDGYGGTSFAAPQLNGVTQLLAESAGKRLGLLNPLLYQLGNRLSSYVGSSAPLKVIASGNNGYYYGGKGYSPAAGVGTLNVANLAAVVK
jgi:subtilase family serine protease